MAEFKLEDFYDARIIPKDKLLTEEQLAFLRKKIKRNDGRMRYGIWKGVQRNGLQIVLLEEFPIQKTIRRPGVDNSIEFIAERRLSDLEYEECLNNFGCNTRTYSMYKYENLEQVMREDLKCKAETPDLFIKECRKRGYTEQINLFTNTEFNADIERTDAEDVNNLSGDKE